jgi:hypothetical protein
VNQVKIGQGSKQTYIVNIILKMAIAGASAHCLLFSTRLYTNNSQLFLVLERHAWRKYHWHVAWQRNNMTSCSTSGCNFCGFFQEPDAFLRQQH